MKSFVAFLPELNFNGSAKRELSPGLFFLPSTHKFSNQLAKDIKDAGYNIKDGAYLYYEGDLKGDLTSYEMFYGYCLAVTFFYKNGQVTCRAVKELDSVEPTKFFIDKFDKFGVDPDDVIVLESKDIKKVKVYHERILPHLSTKEFNAFRNALEFFSLFAREYEIRIRLLYLSICFESLFLEGNDSEGIGHKLGIRCAAFLKNFDDVVDSTATYHEVKCGYNLRSKVIHGGDYQKESVKVIKGALSKATTELDHIGILEKILKNVFHYLLSDKLFYEASQNKSLGNKIDTELVLEKF